MRRTWTFWSKEGHEDAQRLEYLSSKDKLRELGLFSLEKRRLQGDLRAAFQYLKSATRELEGDFLQGLVVIGQLEIGNFNLKVDDVASLFYEYTLIPLGYLPCSYYVQVIKTEQGDKRRESKVEGDGKVQTEMSDWMNIKSPSSVFSWVVGRRVENGTEYKMDGEKNFMKKRCVRGD
ncbi:hypothetical protein BTVI_50012 [Pitangus sulphuratus]|nr:hypothetical protein BTVI_50012 [Pitangus sulphuratus]